MGSQAALEDVLQTLGGTYEAVDIRFSATRADGQWRNCFTIVRFSYKDPIAVAAHQDQLPRLASDHVWVGSIVRPYAEWPQISEDFASGFVRCDGREIRFGNAVSFDASSARVSRTHTHARHWPALELSFGSHQASFLYDTKVERDVNTKGYRDAYELMQLCFEFGVTSNYAPELILSAPVFAMLGDVTFDPRTCELSTRIDVHEKISGLGITGLIRKQNALPVRLPFSPVHPTSRPGIGESHAAVVAPTFEDTALVEIRLTHDVLGEIDAKTEHAHKLLPVAQRSPLFAALSRFCNVSSIRESLVNPGSQSPKKLKESAAFELHISWLLGVLGIPTVVLGDYEYLTSQNGRVRLGSVDILAFDPAAQSLILGGCTLGPPKQEDFTNLLSVRRILEDEVLQDARCAITPVLFTGAKDHPHSVELSNTLIRVIDSGDLSDIMARLADGEFVLLSEVLAPELQFGA
jgi:hypothetical protein